MENHIVLLKAIQQKVPVTCNIANINMLKELFAEYKFIVYALPEKYATVKNYCEGNSYRIRTKIDDAGDTRNSWANKKLLFDEARNAVHVEIGQIISKSVQLAE